MNKMIVPIAVVVVIAIAAIGFFVATSQEKKKSTGSTPPVHESQQMNVQSVQQAPQYKDGTYTVVGNYVSPGGPREVGVTITLKNGVITDSVFEGKATDPTSKRFQGEFADNYKPMVIGKNIADVNLTKVSGSSLTPKGFNDALSKVKTQAEEGSSS